MHTVQHTDGFLSICEKMIMLHKPFNLTECLLALKNIIVFVTHSIALNGVSKHRS